MNGKNRIVSTELQGRISSVVSKPRKQIGIAGIMATTIAILIALSMYYDPVTTRVTAQFETGDVDLANETIMLEIICVAPIIVAWNLSAANATLGINYPKANDTQLEVSQAIYTNSKITSWMYLWFDLNISVRVYAGWNNIRYINFTAWYDEGEDDYYIDTSNAAAPGTDGVEWEYDYHNATYPGGNRNLKISMYHDPVTGWNNWTLLWPWEGYNLPDDVPDLGPKDPNEQEVVLGDCYNETVDPAVGEIGGPVNMTVHFIWAMRQQCHWAPGDGAWDDPTGNLTFPDKVFNDDFSWNFNITIEDRSNEQIVYRDVVTGEAAPINRIWSLGEFGLYKYTSISVYPKFARERAPHGIWTETSPFNVTVSANGAYNLTVQLNHSLNYNIPDPTVEVAWSDYNISSRHVELRLCPVSDLSPHRFDVNTTWGDRPFYNITRIDDPESDWTLCAMTADNNTKINPGDPQQVYGGTDGELDPWGARKGGGWIMRFQRSENVTHNGTHQRVRYAVFRIWIPYGTPGGIYKSSVTFTVDMDENPIKSENS